MEIDRIVCSECVEFMQTLPDGCIDLTVTSPPYDDLRDYKGYTFNFEPIANQLFRITKRGGVVVWVVGDQTINGSETGTSFRQALYFKEIGFNLHDTMIYTKGGSGACGSNKAYWQDFEFMFVFSKGLVKTFNPISDRKNLLDCRARTEPMGHRYKNGDRKEKRLVKRNDYGRRTNVWSYHGGMNLTTQDVEAFDHPAIFPEKLAQDHILSWSNEGDLVFDPMVGSGTSCKMALKNNRHYLGCDISQEYVDISNRRIEIENSQLKLF